MFETYKEHSMNAIPDSVIFFLKESLAIPKKDQIASKIIYSFVIIY